MHLDLQLLPLKQSRGAALGIKNKNPYLFFEHTHLESLLAFFLVTESAQKLKP